MKTVRFASDSMNSKAEAHLSQKESISEIEDTTLEETEDETLTSVT